MSSDTPLESYRNKRDPARTPEPFGFETDPALTAIRSQRFVIQQHAARRMHWDLRLEINGVLASWAVPRGPSVDPKEKRLAVKTEDHPIAYADFEGVIPAGNYGAGAMIVWDRGTYEVMEDATPEQGVTRGKLDFELHGHKLRGRWTLIRTKGGKSNEWLLIRKGDNRAGAGEPVHVQTASVFSGLTVEEVREGIVRDVELATRAAAAGAVRRELRAGDFVPMLAETADEPFSRAGWWFELKHDGIRALLVRDTAGGIRLLSRKQHDVVAGFPEIAKAAAHLPCTAWVLDGEIVALNDQGLSSFPLLQQRLGQREPLAVARAVIEVPVVMYCFDILAVVGYDLRPLPLHLRKELLRLLVPATGVLRFSDHLERDGRELYTAATELGAEGIVAKRADSPYLSGRRSPDWLKIKRLRSADLAVVGYLPGKGKRAALGALLLAWNVSGELRYAGNVGSGLDEQTIDVLLPLLQQLPRATPPCAGVPATVRRQARFAEPRAVATVRYTEVLSSGVLRHPVFLALHTDKDAAACEAPPLLEAEPDPPTPAPVPPPSRTVQFSNLDKVFWPQEGYTKGDLIRYYEQVWPALKPYLEDRPLVLTRYPDGIAGKNFFQKNAPDFTPDWVLRHRIEDTDFFVCNDLDELLYVINSACIPLHIWSARRQALDRPDWTILDLDPKGAPMSAVVRIASEIHKLLAALDTPHFIKTSGQDGLHVLIPLGGVVDHTGARMLAELLARIVTADLPEIATIARPLGERGGKVYVDFLQNGFGKTIVAPFSVRPRAGAPVSAWLDWREVKPQLDPSRFTIRTLPPELDTRAGPGAALLDSPADLPALLDALGQRLAEA